MGMTFYDKTSLKAIQNAVFIFKNNPVFNDKKCILNDIFSLKTAFWNFERYLAIQNCLQIF